MRYLACFMLLASCVSVPSANREPTAEAKHEFGPWQPMPRSEQGSVLANGPGSATAWIFLQAYQNTLSRHDGHTCRFHPTCSGFAFDALTELGPLGAPFAFGRLMRDHTDEDFYPASPDGVHLDDPLEAYLFFLRDDEPEAMRTDDRFGWYHHVHAMEAR